MAIGAYNVSKMLIMQYVTDRNIAICNNNTAVQYEKNNAKNDHDYKYAPYERRVSYRRPNLV